MYHIHWKTNGKLLYRNLHELANDVAVYMDPGWSQTVPKFFPTIQRAYILHNSS